MRGGDEATPGGSGADSFGAARRISASVEVAAPLAVRDGGVGPALRCGRCTPLGRSEAMRADPRASVAAMYSRARTLRTV